MSALDRDKAFRAIHAELHEYEADRGFGVDDLVDALEACVDTEGIIRHVYALLEADGYYPAPGFLPAMRQLLRGDA